MYWFMIMAFTFSSSIDNLGVGISHGIRKLSIQFEKNLLIAVVCFLFSMIGITFGVWLTSILPGMIPLIIGSFLLVIIGVRIKLLAKLVKKEQEDGHIEFSRVSRGVIAKYDGQIGLGSRFCLG